ncbi:MAG TPA: HAD-IB family hydrolase [Nocardioidaceae bacterium]|nr:HAD-IB family hydrolase [Nocardioidaceae bacterium]
MPDAKGARRSARSAVPAESASSRVARKPRSAASGEGKPRSGAAARGKPGAADRGARSADAAHHADADRRLAARLAGKKALVTGVTGFVGEALLQRLLTDVPDVSVAVLARPKGSTTATERVRALLGKPIFAPAVAASGGVDAVLEARLTVLEGDLSAVPELPPDLDVVVHCAGDVSFDPPVDEAFATNVVGTQALLQRVSALGRPVHYVHVSTAYVAGRRRGVIPEGPVEHGVDLAAELAWGLGQRAVTEARSRSAAHLSRLRGDAEREHRRAGLLTSANATEERRREWVRAELVRAGRERARSLGWTDCYTFTKAMGERVVEAYAVDHPVSIVRPSIIESALRTPEPGWIEGFKMAEPLILAYGRGELPEMPATPDSTVDIVPVDLVVSAMVAVMATEPQPGRPTWYHVSSGARNPLTFRRLYDIVRDYYDHHPFEIGDRGAARLPEWRFPGAQRVERLLVTSERAFRAADYLVTHAPRADRTRDLARRLEQQRRRLEFLRRYIDLYREYSQAELVFSDANTLGLFRGLAADDRAAFPFDTASFEWPHYMGEVHCPAVTAPLRRLDAARSKRRGSSTPTLQPLASAPEAKVAAVFDMDGTLLSSNVIETYLWMRLPELGTSSRLAEVSRIAARVPGLVRAERHERSAFLRSMYREYAGARLADLDELADEVLSSQVLARLSPSAVRRVREHRAAGHLTVLVTGAIRSLTRPLRPLFDHIEAAELTVDSRGVCSGFLDRSPLVGESRAAWLRHWAIETGVDLGRSYAYADSHSDLPLLLAVGNPVAVRPDITLFRQAKKNHWPIVDWESSPATGRSLVPAEGR